MTETMDNPKTVAQTRWDQAVPSRYIPDTDSEVDEKSGLRIPKAAQEREWKELPIRLTLEKDKFYGVDLFVDYVSVEIGRGGRGISIDYGVAGLFDARQMTNVEQQALEYEIESLLDSEVVPEEEEDDEGKMVKLTDEERRSKAEDLAEQSELEYGSQVLNDLMSAIADDEEIPHMFRKQLDYFWSDEDNYGPRAGEKTENEIELLQPGEEEFLDIVREGRRRIVVENGEIPETLKSYALAVTEIMERLSRQDFIGSFRKIIPVWSYMRLKYELKQKSAKIGMSKSDLQEAKERLELMRHWLRSHKLEMADAARRMLDKKEATSITPKTVKKGKQMTVQMKKAKLKPRFNPDITSISERLLDYYHAVGNDPEVPIDWLIAEGATVDQIWAAAEELLKTDRIDPPDYWAITATLSGVDYHVVVPRGNPPANEELGGRKKLLKAVQERHGKLPDDVDRAFRQLKARNKGKSDQEIMDMVREQLKLKKRQNPEKDVRVELWCGSDQTPTGLKRAQERYAKARKIAKKHGIETFFDESEDHGVHFMDGYLYPAVDKLEAVLDDLDKAGVEFDNVDFPDRKYLHSKLTKRLYKKYPRRSGVSINFLQTTNNPSFKNAREALKDALKRLTTIEIVEYEPYEPYEPPGPEPTTGESVESLEQTAKVLTEEEEGIEEGVKALEGLTAQTVKTEWTVMFDKERKEHPSLSEEVVKRIVDDHLTFKKGLGSLDSKDGAGERENPSKQDRVVKGFWEKKATRGPKATPMSDPGTLAERRDEVVVWEPRIDDPGAVVYHLWGNTIARLDHDEQGHETFGISTAGWDTNLTNDRLGAILSEGQKKYPILKKFRIAKERGIRLYKFSKVRKVDPEKPWETYKWDEICPIPTSIYRPTEIPKGKLPKYNVYIDLEATLKENIDRLTGKALKQDITEMEIPVDTLDEVQHAIDSIEKGIAEHRAATRDFDSTPVEIAEKLGTRQRFEELLKQRDELMWRGNPNDEPIEFVLIKRLPRGVKKVAEIAEDWHTFYRTQPLPGRLFLENCAGDILEVFGSAGHSYKEISDEFENLPDEWGERIHGNPKLDCTPKHFGVRDVEVKCPVTGKYTWSCSRCALFKGSSEEFIECKAKKGKTYYLAKVRDKRGTVWDTYVLPRDQRKAGIETRAIGGD